VLTEVTERVAPFCAHESSGILLEQETGSRRTGLWKLPALPEPFHGPPPPVLMRSHYGITRYKVTLWVHEAAIAGLFDLAGHRIKSSRTPTWLHCRCPARIAGRSMPCSKSVRRALSTSEAAARIPSFDNTTIQRTIRARFSHA
jgi:hypothetical protein